jgi:hypothetical protein
VWPQSRSSTGISISITSIKSPMAQHSINLGACHYPLYQIQVLGHLLEGWMFTDPSQHEQGGKPFFSEAATTYSGLHIHPPTPSHTSTQTCACMQKYMFSISTCLITFSPLFFSPFLSTSFPPPQSVQLHFARVQFS